ncbi:M15 family metallopeptidase [Nocardioides sp. R1-1]|uniref:M15 family metallopeptidase n=1 Tax=Nocardioides sp. R1-1 TaxID=3383502 RepID=UPI0038D06BAD
MFSSSGADTDVRRARLPATAVLAVLGAVLTGMVALQGWSTVSSSSPFEVLDGGRASGGAAGELPDGATAFDDHPGITRLAPALLEALRRASTDASGDGVAIEVNSGWRSAKYQARLLSEAVREHGSEAEAARWVSTPEESPHVEGAAVDVGGPGARWLAEHGAGYGLCRIYDNEPWHFELRPDAVTDGCPARYPDAAHRQGSGGS